MKHLRTSLGLAVLLGGLAGAAIAPRAAQNSTTAAGMLEAAIQKQLVNGDLAGAIRDYEAILLRFGDQRRIAGQALLRLAQAQEQLGRMDDARRSYDRLARENPDDPSLLRVAQTRLTELDEQADLDDVNRDSLEAARLTTGLTTDRVSNEPSWKLPPQVRSVPFTDISVYDRQSGQTRKLTDGARPAAYPLISPNGQQVAYLSWSGDLKEAAVRRQSGYADARSSAELRVVGINGTNDRTLARFPGIDWLRPFAWSSDSVSVLALLERASGLRQIALISVQSGKVQVLKEQPWLPAQNMSLSEDGEFAAYQVAASRNAPQYEFFVLPVNNTTPPLGERRYAIALAGQRGARVTDDDLAIHVLNRIGFGPRRGDIERVRKMGIEAYIEQQLHPERLADPLVDGIIGNFTSLKMEIPQLLETTAPVAVLAERRRATIFQRPELVARQEAQAKASGVAPSARMTSDPYLLDPSKRPLDIESHMARMIRAVHSEKQLQEVLVDFWMNHFNVNLGDDRLVPSFEEQAIRANVLGRFENMLVAVSRHPKMLFYLDNWRSSAPGSVIEQRLGEQKKSGSTDTQLMARERQGFLKNSKGINENFARELLELHTMGADSGYTQQDVIAVAKILTGWTVGTRGIPSAHEEDGVFMFDPLMHVDGDKVVLGQTFKSGGVDEGMQLLKMLAQRPETAKYISTKLARRFIADTPPAAVVDDAAKTFLRTGGDLREVVRTILLSPQFRSSEAIRSKVKKPFELVTSSLRAVDASFEDLETYARLIDGNRTFISRMGERMYNHEAPDGNPDVGAAWMNSNALLVRFEFANTLALNRLPGVKSNLASAEALLVQLGIPKPTPQQIEHTRSMMEANDAKNAVPGMGGQDQMMMGGTAAGSPAAASSITPAAIAVAAMLGSPQFQKR